MEASDLLGQHPTIRSDEQLQRQLAFLVEIDKLKQIVRQTPLIDGSRKENDAEHSWHLALMAIVLSDYAAEPVDILRVLKMVLIHDLVEIDAGDTFCYDPIALRDKAQREERAAERIFGLLPPDQGSHLRSLWQEFEARSSADARFADALDRFQAMLHNYLTKGGTWREHSVSSDVVLQRETLIREGSPKLWALAQGLLQDAVNRGFLTRSD